jgi:hypothetical protein
MAAWTADRQPGPDFARELLQFLCEQLPAFKRVRRIEFSGLLKEAQRRATGVRVAEEFFEEDFAEGGAPAASS